MPSRAYMFPPISVIGVYYLKNENKVLLKVKVYDW